MAIKEELKMREYEAYIRYYKDDIVSKEAQEIELMIRDVENYLYKPVIAKVHSSPKEGADKLWVYDPLGRLYRSEPWWIEIIREEDEEKLITDMRFKKCVPRF